MESIKIKITSDEMKIIDLDGEYEPFGTERECTAITCWYDPHYRHWVLYPVDAEGNQLDEASYGFGKKEAPALKKAMNQELIGRKYISF